MTRLIDADRLKKSFEANTPIAFQDCVPGIHAVIDLERTVDAIPVEWIKQFINKENIDIIHKVGIVYMVEQWKLHPINFEISSEDAIPVIRCKDCKYYDGEYYHYIKGERMRFCKHDMWDGWNENDFCSYAERKK